MKKVILFIFVWSFLCGYSENITIYFTGKTYGKIEPCSCYKNPDGGIFRRVSFFNRINKDPSTFFVDTGNDLTGGFGEYYKDINAQLRNKLLLEAYRDINYDIIVPGLSELQRSNTELLKIKVMYDLPLMALNIKGFNTFKIFKVGKQRIIFLTLACTKYENFNIHSSYNNTIIDYYKALDNILRKYYRRHDLVILVSSLDKNEVMKLIKYIPMIDIAIYGKNTILLTRKQLNKKHLLFESYFESKRVGKLSIKVKKGHIISYDLSYIRMSPSIPINIKYFKKSINILGIDHVKKFFHVYIFLNNILIEEHIMPLLKFLVKNRIPYYFVFNTINRNNAYYFKILNNNPEQFFKHKISSNLSTDEYLFIKHKNQLLIKNFGNNYKNNSVFTGLRYLEFDKNLMEHLKSDIQTLKIY